MYQKAKSRKSVYLGGAENGFLGNVMILEENGNRRRGDDRDNAHAINDLKNAISCLSGV